MNSVKRYFILVKTYLRNSLKDALEFKSDFVISLFAQIVYLILTYLVALGFTTAVPKLGLTTLELFVYTNTVNIIFGMIRSSSENTITLINSGRLNTLLTRPANILFQIYFNDFSLKYFISNLINLIIMAIILITTNINFVLYLITMIVTTIIGTLLFQGIYLLLKSYDLKKLWSGTFVYRTSNENNITGMMAIYPLYLFPKIVLIYVAFFPIYYVGNSILNIIKHAGIWEYILILVAGLLVAIIFLIAANLAWKKMLKYYEGFGG